MKQLKIILCTLFTLFLMGLTNGEKAPEFPAALKDQSGKERKLSDFLGKYVVLEWFNDGCPYVKAHYKAKNMQTLQKKYVATDKVVWLTINSSAKGKQGYISPEKSSEIYKQHQMASNYLLLDSDGKTGKLYDAKTTPHMYVIDPKGLLVYQGAIDDQQSIDGKSVLASDSYLSKNNHVASVLDDLLAGKKVRAQNTAPYGCSVKY